MRALLLAAGRGTRLRPLTQTIPKCLVSIAGKPLLQHWLDLLFVGGIERVLINTHYLSEQVVHFVDASEWRDRIDVVHEEELLGTAGTLKANRSFFPEGRGLLAHADNLTRFEPSRFMERHANRAAGIEMTMMTFESDRPRECGIVAEGDRGVVTGFFEKLDDPPGTRANGAVYIFEPSILRFLDSIPRVTIDFSTEVLPHFVGRIQTFLNADYHRDIGTPESLARARDDFERRSFATASPPHACATTTSNDST